MLTVLVILLVVVLFFGAPLVFVVSFVAAGTRKALRAEAAEAAAASPQPGEDHASEDTPPG